MRTTHDDVQPSMSYETLSFFDVRIDVLDEAIAVEHIIGRIMWKTPRAPWMN